MSLAIVISHPIQYCSPWFRYLAANGFPGLHVFYLWDGAARQVDPGFGVSVKWDVPLLEGYAHEFVPNRARHPGTDRICGLNNPGLVGLIEKFNPDAVVVFGYNYYSLYRLLFSRLPTRIPFLFRGDSHRLVPSAGLKAKFRRLWISRVYAKFAAFLYVGQANKEYFRYHGVPESKLFFCPHCVDNERFFSEAERAVAAAEWKRELGIAPDQRVVLFAGKFTPKKRPLDLVAAFKEAKLPVTTLVLVGNGEQEAELRKQAAGCKDIVFAPFQNQTQMPRTYTTGDVFVLPSFGRDETWGLAVNEAMCMGRPVIVSDRVGCAQDLVEPKRNGLVFQAGNVEALATALREAFSDPGRLKSWGERSRELVRGYSYEQATKGLERAMKGVLSFKF